MSDVMDHSPGSPNLMPNNIRLCEHLNKHLAGKWFAADTDMKQAVTSWPQTVDSNLFCTIILSSSHSGTSALMSMIATLKSDVYNLLPVCHVNIKVWIKLSSSECLLPSFLKFPCITVTLKLQASCSERCAHTYCSTHQTGSIWIIQYFSEIKWIVIVVKKCLCLQNAA
jgi:hypothetical protein